MNKPLFGSTIFFIITIFALTGCLMNALDRSGEYKNETRLDPVANTKWQLSTYGEPGVLKTALPDRRPTLNFTTDEVSGNTGCNRYSANYSVIGERLALRNLFWTEKGCSEEGVMEQEAEYLTLITEVDTYQLDDEGLLLYSQEKVLHFQSIQSKDNDPLVGRLWNLESIAHKTGSSHSVENLPQTAYITMWFEDGNVTGYTGCNHYAGPYELAANTISIGADSFEMTAQDCQDEVIRELEKLFLQGLRVAEKFQIEGDHLTIVYPQGELVFIYQNDLAVDESAVYSAVLREWDGGVGPYVILDTTQFNEPGVSLEQTIQTVQAQISSHGDRGLGEVEQQTLDDFMNKNRISISLRDVLAIAMPYHFIAQAESDSLFEQDESGSAWDIIDENYSGASGIYSFSRVGFNKTGDQALVYMGMQSREFAGGYYTFMLKDHGMWLSSMSFLIWQK